MMYQNMEVSRMEMSQKNALPSDKITSCELRVIINMNSASAGLNVINKDPASSTNVIADLGTYITECGY
jgi:hypothetical protein